ncbi:hypothetical protein [Nocardioides sp. 1609]|uniref:ATP-grasp domain-containing protein n=1 Tax=Nocardioides sp. 1609 TaxID=2508327 RepID=UPI0014322CBA|nr:hypothetical protein [Nocardioides sp. 1609]
MTDVLLVTCSGYPDGEPGHELLDAALAELGVSSRWAVWDDPSVDWAGARLVAVRSTWDYQDRRPEFLTWAEGIGPALVNGAAAFRWNTDKSYLVDLAEQTDLPVVPSVLAGDEDAVRAAAGGFGTAVVKPRVGASGVGVEVVVDAAAWRPAVPGSGGPWLVQPLVDSVHREGEQSVFVLDGRPVSQARKVTGGHDVRVHERHGGTTTAVPLEDAAARLAVDAVAVASGRTGADLLYARVDLLHLDGRPVVSEVEVTEPGLYLRILPANATALAAALAARL